MVVPPEVSSEISIDAYIYIYIYIYINSKQISMYIRYTCAEEALNDLGRGDDVDWECFLPLLAGLARRHAGLSGLKTFAESGSVFVVAFNNTRFLQQKLS